MEVKERRRPLETSVRSKEMDMLKNIGEKGQTVLETGKDMIWVVKKHFLLKKV